MKVATALNKQVRFAVESFAIPKPRQATVTMMAGGSPIMSVISVSGDDARPRAQMLCDLLNAESDGSVPYMLRPQWFGLVKASRHEIHVKLDYDESALQCL